MANSHQKEKRHSLSALSFSQNSPQSTASYRHSMEVLIGSTTDSTFGSDSQNKGPGPQTPVSNVLVPPTVPTQWAESTGARIVRHHSGRRERNTGNSTPQKETSETESGSSNGIPTSSSHGPSNTHVPVPIFYVAVYNYKPHKEDELELKKGELYTVCEKCQDGWFKGTSLRTGRSGVFPGNYVQLPKTSSLQPHFPQGVPPAGSMKLPASKIVSVSSPPMPVSTMTAQAMQSQSFCSSGNGSKPSGSYLNNPRSKHTESRCGILVGLREWTQSLAGIAPPPQHLPRPQPSSRNGISAVQKIKTSNGNAPKALVGAPRHTEWDVAAAPMAASYPVSSTGRTQSLPTSGSITLSWYNTNQNNGHQRSTPLVSLSAATAVTPPNVCIGVPAGESSDGASTGNTRSEKQKEKKEREKVSLVKRLTSKRKSKSPPPSNYCDNPTFVDTPLTTTGATQIQAMHVRSGSCPSKALGGHQVSHKKSNSLDVNNADHAKPSSRPRQPAPLVRERFRCIVPYPPNSELELELKVGDIVYVHKKREDGWYKGTLQRTGKTGLFPGSFVESF
ncbi:E3 ubiquitin-protein ligase SH3RF3-like [Tachypleus tridentatus]|uniref:E3 ubiquitin-protein ligase SH3RF3-like n=1 Tax=Tachypleus tridentatus TaxID=6853 RepID=UPI003FD43C42